ncbi:MAG TPA: DUF4349 domain-containing protein, partial [Planctomycetota bacterium]|nr:DUF4349 domain-containing protein [Planctomycetota bacterium]
RLDQAGESYQRDYTVDSLHESEWSGYIALPSVGGAGHSARAHIQDTTGGVSKDDAIANWSYLGWAGKLSRDRLEDTTLPSYALEGESMSTPLALPSLPSGGPGQGQPAGLAGTPSNDGPAYKSANAQMEPLAKVKLRDELQKPTDPGNGERAKYEADMQVFFPQLAANRKELDDLGQKLKTQPATPAPDPEKPARTDPRPSPQDVRKIIRTADLDLEVDSYDATSTKLEEMVKLEKGFVATANIQKLANGKIRAVVTVRVPPEQFEGLMTRLRALGTVRNQNIGSQDITKAYLDLDTRRASKEALLERLKKLLAEAKGTVKELLEVEVQMGKTIEEIEAIKGELKYYDSQVSLSTITLTISEKDLGQPFEYVQTLQSSIGLTAPDADDVYAKAQKEILDAGGQVVDSKMNRQNDGSATATVRARVDAEKFPALRAGLKRLGRVTDDTVTQQRTARGGAEGAPKADAPLKKEQAVVDLTITTPPLVITRRARLLVENVSVQEAYPAARKTVEAAGGKVVSGSLTGREASATATLTAQIDADKFNALVESLKTAGKVKDSAVRQDLPAASPDGTPQLLRERAEIELLLVSPPQLIDEEHGFGRTIRDTFAGSWKGVLWSIEKLFVGASLAGPWLGLGLLGWLGWRRFRKKKPGVA